MRRETDRLRKPARKQMTLQLRAVASSPRPAAPGKLPWLCSLGGAALMAAAIAAAYWPCLRGEFVLDDDKLITANDLVRAPDGLARIWFSTQAEDYWPLTNSLFWLQWRISASNPIGYHLVSWLLHLVSALLIWRILRILEIPGAFLAALLFAMHPVNVQSVAWISEQKNALAMVFALMSILWYLKAEEGKCSRGANEKGGWNRRYWLSLLAFVLAMLSKGSVAVLPLVLVLIVCWQRQRITRGDLWRTAPFFVVAAGLTAVNVWFTTHGTDVVVRDVTFAQRLAGAGAAVWFYLSKALVPIDLVFIYPLWHIPTSDLLWWLPLLACVAVTAVLWSRRKRPAGWARSVLFAWMFFCLALLPVLGFVDVGFMRFSLVADHYQHLAIISVTALAATGWSIWRIQARGLWRGAANSAAVAALAALLMLSRQQSSLFADAVSLYRNTLQRNPQCWVVHNNLGVRFLDANDFRDAESHLEESVRLNPNYADAYNNLGNVFLKTGHYAQALEEYERALRLKPNLAETYANMALTYAQLGRSPEAIAAAEKALDIAQSQNHTLVARKIADWLTSYRAGQRGAVAPP